MKEKMHKTKETENKLKEIIQNEVCSVSSLKIIINEKQVKLNGYCRSFYHKQLAQTIAMQILGNEYEIKNSIAVLYRE